MRVFDSARRRWSKAAPFEYLPISPWAGQRPTVAAADPKLIAAALRRSATRRSGNWYAFAASGDVCTRRPSSFRVGGHELVAWRDQDATPVVGSSACPHLGADLSTGVLDGGALICSWHGLRLTGCGASGWRPYPSHDDGVLAWVRLDLLGGEPPTEAPVIARRPDAPRVQAVTRLVGGCEPRDIIANRLDPWHGAWFHPYSFTRLEVLAAPPASGDVDEESDRFLVAVTFRIGRLGVPVIAEFASPEKRTVVMRIVEGEGTGSVVETHATPLGRDSDGRPRTAVIEAVIAHSDRPGFTHALRAARLIRPVMRAAATRLWRDDLAYAERLYQLRTR